MSTAFPSTDPKRPTDTAVVATAKTGSAPTKPSSIPLDDPANAPLKKLIIEATSRIRTTELGLATIQWLIGLLSVLFAFVLIDHWVASLGTAARLAAFSTVVLGSIAWFFYRIVPLATRRINPEFAVLQIERHNPELKDGLITWFQLASRSDSTPQRGILNTVGRYVTGYLRGQDVDSMISQWSILRFVAVLFGLVFAMGIYLAVSPKSGVSSMARLILPWQDIAPATRVQFTSITPGDAVVTLGMNLPIAIEVKGWNAGDQARIRYSTDDGHLVDQYVVMGPEIENLSYKVELGKTFGGIEQPMHYWIEAGDAVAGPFSIEVQAIPVVVIERVEYAYPDYMRLAPRISEGDGRIEAPEGTRVTLYARSNQPLKSGKVELDFSWTPERNFQIQLVEDAMVEGKVLTQNRIWTLDQNRSNPTTAAYRIRSTNDRDERNVDAVVYPVKVLPDLPPEIQIAPGKPDRIKLPENQRLPIEVRALDPDYGLRSIRIEGLSQRSKVIDQTILEDDEGRRGQSTLVLPFDPRRLGLRAGDKVELKAIASDNRRRPGSNELEPNVRQSRTLVIEIEPADPDTKPSGENGDSDQPDSGQDSGKGETGNEDSNGKNENGDKPNDGTNGQGDEKSDENKGGQQGDEQKQDGSESNDSNGSQSSNSPDQSVSTDRADGSEGSEGSDSSDQAGGAGDSSNSDGSDGSDGSQSGLSVDESNDRSGAGQRSNDSNNTVNDNQNGNLDEITGAEGGERGADADPMHDGETFERLKEFFDVDPTVDEARDPSLAEARPSEQNSEQSANDSNDPDSTPPFSQDLPPESNQRPNASSPNSNASGGNDRDRSDSPSSDQDPADQTGQRPSTNENDPSQSESNQQNSESTDRGQPGEEFDPSNPETSQTDNASSDNNDPDPSSQLGSSADQEPDYGQPPEQGDAQEASGESESGKPSSESVSGTPSQASPSQSDSSDPSQAASDAQSKKGNESAKSSPGGNQGTPQMSDQPEPPRALQEETEYARKATELILNALDRQRDQPDPELLNRLGWTKEQLQAFVDRWKSAKQEAILDPSKQADYEDTLRSLGLTPGRSRTRSIESKPDQLRGMMEEGNRVRPPESLRERFEAFRRAAEGQR